MNNKRFCSKNFGWVRPVYNTCLEIQNSREAAGKPGMSCFRLQALLPGIKKEKPFLKEPNSRSLQHAVVHLTRAYINYEEGRAAHPVFKKKYARQPFHVPQYVSVSNRKNGIKTLLPEGYEATGIAISDPDVYVSGNNNNNNAIYWKNGEVDPLGVGGATGIFIGDR